MTDYIDIVFDGPPSHDAGRFVETEDDQRRSVNFGAWIDRGDGYWVLRVSGLDLAALGERRGRTIAELDQMRELIGRQFELRVHSEGKSGVVKWSNAAERTIQIEEQLRTCLSNGTTIADLQAANDPDKKCIVHGCCNRHSDGGFVGDLCVPCHEMLTTGKIGAGTTFLQSMSRAWTQDRDQLAAANKIIADFNHAVAAYHAVTGTLSEVG